MRNPINPTNPIELSRPFNPRPLYPSSPTPFIPIYSPQPKSNFTNINNPYELNSIADVILTTFNPDMERWDLGGFEKVPLLNIIPGALQMFTQTSLKPIMERDWKALGINNLTNFIETFDILANPIKGLAMEGPQGLVNALGWGDEGRVNYYADTGNVLVDMGVELIADPLNWITLFGKGALTSSLSSFGRLAIRDSMGDLGEVLVRQFGEKTIDTFYTNLAKRSLSNYFNNKNMVLAKAVDEAAKSFAAHPVMKYIAQNHLDDFTKVMQKVADTIIDQQNVRLMTNLQSLITTTDAFQRQLWRATFANTGFGAGYYLLKNPASWLRQYVHARTQDALEEFKTPSGNYDILKTDEIIDALEKNKIKFNQMLPIMDQLPEEMKQAAIEFIVKKEKSNIYKILQEPIEKYPFINVEGRMKLLRDKLEEELGGDVSVLIGVLDELNQKSKGAFQPYLDYLSRTFDVAAQIDFYKKSSYKLMGELNRAYRETEGLPVKQRIEQFIKLLEDKTGDASEFLKILRQANKDYGDILKDFEDLLIRRFRTYVREQMGINKLKEFIYQNWLGNITKDAETHLKMLEDFIKKEHPGINTIDDYLNQLFTLNLKFDGVYTEFEEQLRALVSNYREAMRLQEEYSSKYRDYIHAQQIADDVAPQLATWRALTKISDFLEESPDQLPDIMGNIEATLKNTPNISQDKIDKFLNLLDEFDPDVPGTQTLDAIKNFIWKEIDTLEKLRARQKYNPNPEVLTNLNAALRTSSAQFIKNYEELIGAALKPEFTKDGRIIDLRPGVEEKAITEWIQGQGPEVFRQLKVVEDTLIKFFFGTSPQTFAELEEKIALWYAKYAEQTPTVNLLAQPPSVRPQRLENIFISQENLVELLQEVFVPVVRKIKDLDGAEIEVTQLSLRPQKIPTLYNALKFASFQAASLSQSSVFDAVLAELDKLPQPVLYTKFHLAELSHDMLYFTLKLDQDYVLDLIMSDRETFRAFMDMVDPETEMGALLKNLAETGNEAAIALSQLPQYYFNYYTFLDNLYKTDLNPKVRDAFKNVVQKAARTPVFDLLDDREALERFMWRIFNDIELQINSTEMTEALNLEALRLRKEFDDIRHTFGRAHSALADAEFTYHLQDRLLKDELPDAANTVKICWDIETTGQSPILDEIREMGIFVKDGEQIEVKVEISKMPLDSVIAKIYQFDPKKSLAQQYREYYKDQLHSEAEAIFTLIDTIEKYMRLGQDVVLITHNGTKFDNRFLKERLYQVLSANFTDPEIKKMYIHAQAVLNQVKQRDTLKLLQEKHGYYILDSHEKIKIQALLNTLIQAQSVIDDIDPVLIQPVDTDVAALLKEVGAAIRVNKRFDYSYGATNPFMDFANRIYEAFGGIKARNKELGNILYSKSLYEDLEFQKLYGLNSSQSLHSIKQNDGTRQMLPGTKPFSTKNVSKGSVILDFFNMPPGTVLEMQIIKFYTRLGNIIQSNYNRLKNYHVIQKYQHEINLFLRNLLLSVKYNNIQNPVLNYLKIHDDPALNMAVIHFILARSHKDPRLQVIVDKMLKEPVYAGLKDYLTNPRLMRRKELTEAEILFLDDAADAINIERQALREFVYDMQFIEKRKQWDLEAEAIHAEKQKMYEELFTEENLKAFEESYLSRKLKEHGVYIELKDTSDEELQRMLDALDPRIFGQKKLSKLSQKNFKDEMFDPEAYYRALDKVLENFINGTDALKNLGNALSLHEASRAMIQHKASVLRNIVELFQALKARHANIKTLDDQHAQALKYTHMTDDLAQQMLYQVLKLSDEGLVSLLAHQARRIIIFDGLDYIDNPVFAQALIDLAKRETALKAKGVHIMRRGTEWFIVLDKEIDTAQVPKIQLAELDFARAGRFLDAPEDAPILEALAPVRAQIGRLTNNDYVGSLCEVTTKKSYEILYNALPEELKALLPAKEIMFQNKNFSHVNFNFSLLGSARSKRKYFEYTPSDIFSIYANTVKFQSKNLQTITEYMELFFDKTLSINVGLLKDVPAEELINAFKNSPEFRLVALVKNPKMEAGCEVVEIMPRTVKDIQRARRLNAVIMPTQTFSKAYSTINNFQFTQAGLNVWHKIIYLYKAGYLANPAVIFKNLVDALIKNSITTQDPLGMFPYYKKGFQLYHRYHRVIKDILKLSEERTGESVLSPEWADIYFQTMTPALDRETYFLVHNFIQDGASAGQVKTLEDFYQLVRMKKLKARGEFIEPTLSEQMWDGVVKMLGLLLAPHKEVEQIARLSEYLWAIEKKGMSDTAAFQIVSKTHFDYALKTPGDHYRELIFPFYTYIMRNLQYWVDALEETPWLANVFQDIMTPVWDLDGYDRYELEHNQSLQYQILSGNIPLNDKGLTLKLNPSIMDLYNMLTDPFNSVKEKMAAPLQMGVDEFIGSPFYQEFLNASYGFSVPRIRSVSDFVSVLPIVGTFKQRYGEQGAKYFDRTGNFITKLLPGLFGGTLRYQPKKFKPTSFSYTPKSKRPQKARKVWRAWRYYAERTYARRKYAEKSFARKAYYSHTYHRPPEYDSFYMKHYTKTGASRLKLRMQPVTPGTLQYRIKDMFHHLK
jgi:hypothetical protein